MSPSRGDCVAAVTSTTKKKINIYPVSYRICEKKDAKYQKNGKKKLSKTCFYISRNIVLGLINPVEAEFNKVKPNWVAEKEENKEHLKERKQQLA